MRALNPDLSLSRLELRERFDHIKGSRLQREQDFFLFADSPSVVSVVAGVVLILSVLGLHGLTSIGTPCRK